MKCKKKNTFFQVEIETDPKVEAKLRKDLEKREKILELAEQRLIRKEKQAERRSKSKSGKVKKN